MDASPRNNPKYGCGRNGSAVLVLLSRGRKAAEPQLLSAGKVKAPTASNLPSPSEVRSLVLTTTSVTGAAEGAADSVEYCAPISQVATDTTRAIGYLIFMK